MVPARAAAARALRTLHTQTLERLLAADVPWPDDRALRHCRDELLIEWIEALPERIDATALPTAEARRHLVARAREHVLSQPGEPLSLLALCQHLGVSRRKLNYCFHDVLGMSPMRYLRVVRLDGARRELRAACGPVQEVASRWGFAHMGQFAVDYRRHFGESPSATLGRGR